MFNGFTGILFPANRSRTVIPFYMSNEPLFILTPASIISQSINQSSTVNIIQAMGSVLRARMIQIRVVEADQAKTAFLSSMSHELRTPMHGNGRTRVEELIAAAVEAEEWDDVKSILTDVRTSGRTLGNKLNVNDVLDFGRDEHHRGPIMGSATAVDLVQAAKDVSMVCSTRRVEPLAPLIVEFI